jgi:hypothetical protein
MEHFGKVERIKIPDEDVPGWMKALREGGLTDKEIDGLLGRTNKTYRKALSAGRIEEEVNRIEQHFRDVYHKALTPEEREEMKKDILKQAESDGD